LHLVFVFGTLKRGFPLHNLGLEGAKYLGVCRTVEAYPVVIAGPWFAPMMFDLRRSGVRVEGELYAVDDQQLARLDDLESVGTPGNFRRQLEVEMSSPRRVTHAFAFMKDPRLAVPIHSDFLSAYHDRRFIPPWKRSESVSTARR